MSQNSRNQLCGTNSGDERNRQQDHDGVNEAAHSEPPGGRRVTPALEWLDPENRDRVAVLASKLP
jgi:hypothetical protein